MLIYYMLMFVLYFIIYLMLVIMGIGHDLVDVHLCSYKDRLLSCLCHPFGSVAFPFISSRMALSLLANSFL
jgi:hypothetical protein